MTDFVNNFELNKSHRDSILKSLPIGSIREWVGGSYKKVGEGEWVKVLGDKTKSIALSGLKKVINNELKENVKEYQRIIDEYEKNWKIENQSDIYTIQAKIRLGRDKDSDPGLNSFREKYLNRNRELREELSEVENLFEIKAKKAREEKFGKKEVGINDELFINHFKAFHVIFQETEQIPSSLPASKIAPSISTDDYWLNTDTIFQSVYEYKKEDANSEDGVWRDPVLKKWNEMKRSGKYEFTQSPKSSSQYLVDKESGDIFRCADHWGRCASCNWANNFSQSDYGIGVSNIKDFKRNDGYWSNPNKEKAIVASSKSILDTLKKMLADKEVYFDDKASERIKNITSKIDSNLKFQARLSEELILKIKDDYKEVFEFNNDSQIKKAFLVLGLR